MVSLFFVFLFGVGLQDMFILCFDLTLVFCYVFLVCADFSGIGEGYEIAHALDTVRTTPVGGGQGR